MEAMGIIILSIKNQIQKEKNAFSLIYIITEISVCVCEGGGQVEELRRKPIIGMVIAKLHGILELEYL